MPKITLKALRRHALASTFFRPTTLQKAVEQLGFVQADPIRSPARAQDLILRQRVRGYRAGDLELRYPKLGIEEDFLYAYGFMPQATWRWLHPRAPRKLTVAEKKVLNLVSKQASLHPRDLEAHLGRAREVNAWGGYSKATTRTLHSLHFRGLLRVAGRENGIRLYEVIREGPKAEIPDHQERLKQLVLLIARILQPIPERSLRATLQLLARAVPHLEGRHSALTTLVSSGELASAEVDGLRYFWPAGPLQRKAPAASVRILTPFDPLVWDRRRFEHFWGWVYRFEAYTPLAKRKMGYYAMPLLWRESIVGWVNVSQNGSRVEVETGFVDGEPSETGFKAAFEHEVERMRLFLARRP